MGVGVAPTLRTVVRRPPLGLGVLAGGDALDRPVRWVAVSELEDPTPFLEGGELVLTTGMRLDAGNAGPYVERLVGREVAGLGFGVGLGHETIPGELVEAATRAGLPLLEVPRDTPFVAIGKAVSELLAAEQYDELSRAFAAQGRLTRAALRPEGPRAVIDRLARELDGWAILLDEAGGVRHAAGRGSAGAADGLGPELERLRKVSNRGAPASVALSSPKENVIVQPFVPPRQGIPRRRPGRPFTPVAHTVVNAAGSLLTLAVEHGREHLAAERRVRSAVLRLLLAGQPDAGCETLERLGSGFPQAPWWSSPAPVSRRPCWRPRARRSRPPTVTGWSCSSRPRGPVPWPRRSASTAPSGSATPWASTIYVPDSTRPTGRSPRPGAARCR